MLISHRERPLSGKTYYYTIDATGETATQHGSAIGYATSDPYGDGTVWINDSYGLHVEGSAAYYKINSLTTDQPYWLKYNASMNLLYAAISGPIAKINNNSMWIANVINTYDGENWANATAYTAAGAGYAFEFSPVAPTTYVRASWNKGLFKVTNNVMKTNYTSSNAKIGNLKPTPAFDNYGNLWVVCSYGNSSMPVVVLPADKFAKTTATKSDWYQPSGLLSVASFNTMQRTCFLVARKNNMKIYCDGDIPPNGKGELFCWDNGEVDPTIDTYHLVNLSRFIDQNDRVILGNRNPRLTAGWSNTISWKGFELTLDLQGRFKYMVSTGGEGQLGMYQQREISYWTPSNTGAEWQKPVYSQAGGDPYSGLLGFKNASFIKIRNLSLGYNFDKKVLKSIGLNGLKLYVQGRNLGMLYSSIDFMDLDTGRTYFNRGVTAGVQVDF